MYTYGCSMGFNLVSLYGFASDSCDSSSLFLAQRPWGLQKTPKQTEQRATPRRATLCRGGAPRPRHVSERRSARRPWRKKNLPTGSSSLRDAPSLLTSASARREGATLCSPSCARTLRGGHRATLCGAERPRRSLYSSRASSSRDALPMSRGLPW